ncbi:hypothetical protein EIP86_001883 [Pleurotus ostreatoroseus]|nr:hypothetical protein EIP86_001883 [Pleurotus ostreatoroseus]
MLVNGDNPPPPAPSPTSQTALSKPADNLAPEQPSSHKPSSVENRHYNTRLTNEAHPAHRFGLEKQTREEVTLEADRKRAEREEARARKQAELDVKEAAVQKRLFELAALEEKLREERMDRQNEDVCEGAPRTQANNSGPSEEASTEAVTEARGKFAINTMDIDANMSTVEPDVPGKAASTKALTRLLLPDHPFAVEHLRRYCPWRRVLHERRTCHFYIRLVDLREACMVEMYALARAIPRMCRELDNCEVLLALLGRTCLLPRLAEFVTDVFALCDDVPMLSVPPSALDPAGSPTAWAV